MNRFRPSALSDGPSGAKASEPLHRRLARDFRARPERPFVSKIAIGVLAGLVAVAIRYWLPLRAEQLPTLPVVVMLAIVTTFTGVRAGIATAAVGGVLSWYLFFNAYSWSLANDAWIPLLGFATTATVIVTTAHLYRSSERRGHDQEVAQLRLKAEHAAFFAREMAHRQKNTLTIVQSLAFQTIGTGSEKAAAFAGRLKAIAEANALLDEHIDTPSAQVTDAVEAALRPFVNDDNKFDIQIVDATISDQQVVSLALALHELAANAVQYGAFSVPGGSVSLRIEDAGDRLMMNWREQGGPAVTPPQAFGFGTNLLKRTGIGTDLAFEPDGLRCSMGLRKSSR